MKRTRKGRCQNTQEFAAGTEHKYINSPLLTLGTHHDLGTFLYGRHEYHGRRKIGNVLAFRREHRAPPAGSQCIFVIGRYHRASALPIYSASFSTYRGSPGQACKASTAWRDCWVKFIDVFHTNSYLFSGRIKIVMPFPHPSSSRKKEYF